MLYREYHRTYLKSTKDAHRGGVCSDRIREFLAHLSDPMLHKVFSVMDVMLSYSKASALNSL